MKAAVLGRSFLYFFSHFICVLFTSCNNLWTGLYPLFFDDDNAQLEHVVGTVYGVMYSTIYYCQLPISECYLLSYTRCTGP